MLGGLNTRKLMSFFESPGFAERFGVQKHADPEMGQPVDDWLVYYEAVDRLIQQLKAAGKNGAVITVLSDGSALFPSNSIEPTPRYDTGIFASDGRDPIRKDVVEMMYLMFEREGLWLVPALKFSSTLPAVERFRAETGEVQGFDLVNFRGDRPNQVEANLLPIYNPLDVRVQKAITDAVSEFADRYRRFASFQGVALVCHPTAITGLSGRRWGYDKATRQRFIGSIEGSLEKQPESWKAEQQLLLAARYADWMDWRRLQMSNWYRELHKQISEGVSGIRTLIAPVDVFRYPEIESLVTPSLHQKPNLDDVMLRLGFDPKFFSEEPGITLLKPVRFAPNHSLASRRTEFGIDHSGKLDRWFSESGSRGSVISHRSTWAHFQQLENSDMFARQQLPLMRLQPFSLSEDWNRRRYVEELKSNDSQLLIEGGMAIPNGQENGFNRFVNVYSSLPTQAFESIPSAIEPEKEHPVAVRQLRVGDEHYFYAVNDSPWPVEIRLAATEAVPLNLDMFNDESEFTMADKNMTVTVRLEPFGIVGGRAIGGAFAFNKFSYQLPAEAAQDLKQHYFKLRAKLISASQSQVLPVLQNPKMEAGPDGLPAGWTVSEPDNFSVGADPTSGNSVLTLKSAGENVWIRSNEFQAPETGRLSISVWLRADDPAGQPPLRISVEGTSQEGAYYRFGSVGSLAADKEVNQIGPQWKRFAVHFDDLPTRDLARLRIGFDLMGAGEIGIERVEVYDRWFDENDVKAVTQLLAGVGPLLANTESLERCRNVLGGYWPTFLDNSFEQLDSSSTAEKTAGQPDPSFSDESSAAKQKSRRLNAPKWFQFR